MSSTRRPSQRPRPLTQTEIEKLKPRPGEQFVQWDRTLAGFGVRVNPQGTKTYILKYRLPTGRVRWKKLGRFGAIPLEKVRKQAQADIGIVAVGKDPLVFKDAARDAPTLGDVADRFLEDHVEARRKANTQRL